MPTPAFSPAIAVSRDEAERLRFWSGRKNAFPASVRISPDYMCMDSTIPRKRLADILLQQAVVFRFIEHEALGKRSEGPWFLGRRLSADGEQRG